MIQIELSNPENVEILENLSHSGFNVFPDRLLDCVRLKRLNLAHNKLTQLPESLTKLSELEMIDLSANPIQAFPKVLTTLVNLRELRLPASALAAYPEMLLDCPKLEKLTISGLKQGSNLRFLPKLLLDLRKRQLSKACGLCFLDMLANRQDKISEPAQQTLFLASQSPIKIIQLKGMEALGHYFERHQIYSLNAKSVLSLLGRLSASKREINQLISKAGIKRSSQLTERITHIVIGKGVEQSYEELVENKRILLSEKNLRDFLNRINPPHLIALGKQQRSRLLHLQTLLNGSTSNRLLAFQLLQSGGVPEQLLTNIFIVYKSTKNDELRRQAKKMLQRHGSASLRLLLPNKVHFRIFQADPDYYYNDIQITKELELLDQAADLDGLKLARYLFKNDQSNDTRAIGYLLRYADSLEKLNLLKGMMKDSDSQDFLYLANLGLDFLPKEIFALGDNLRELRLGWNRLPNSVFIKNIPNFRLLRGLKEVRLGGNPINDPALLLIELSNALPSIKFDL